VLAQGDDIVPIPGTKRRKYLEENIAATAVVISEDEKEEIDEVLPKGAAVGERYPASSMTTINR
jgi:aryl-alcohol dehydrogenase-like predicted oxidoreductase